MMNSAANGAHFYAYDGNGNVAALVKASDGTTSANYEYGPFGEGMRATGLIANENRFQFSTKRTDRTTELNLYEFRVRRPALDWASRDPLASRSALLDASQTGGAPAADDPEIEPTLFVRNDPISRFDSLGLWPSQFDFLGVNIPTPRTHQRAIRRAIPSLSYYDEQWVVAAVVYVDSSAFQSTENSFMHAMRAPKQSIADARSLANTFVRTHIREAERLLCWTCTRLGSREQALWEFGLALHTIQDATSPSHPGFQVWHGLFPLEAVYEHVRDEGYDPGSDSALDKATAWFWTFFECEYGAPTLPGDFFETLSWDPPSWLR
jgi:hypothetical protein